MATFNFNPTTSSNYRFQPTLDGDTYTVVVDWNVYGQRYYVNVYNLSNTRVFTLPLIGSPLDTPISMTAGYFTSTLVYYPSLNQFVVLP